MRRLKLYYGRIVRKFNSICLKHLQANNIQDKAQQITSQATYPPPPYIDAEMQKLDDQIGRAIRVTMSARCLERDLYLSPTCHGMGDWNVGIA